MPIRNLLFQALIRNCFADSEIYLRLPQLGPMQVPAGTRGAESYSSFDLDADIDFTISVNESTNASLPNRDVDFYITYAGFNIKDAVRPQSEIPLQFAYEPADCRIFYTVNTVYNQENLWNYVIDAIWRNPSLCIAGSTNYVPPNPTMDTTGPSDEQKQQWKTVQPDSVGSLVLSGYGHVKRDESAISSEKRTIINNQTPSSHTSNTLHNKKKRSLRNTRKPHTSKKPFKPRDRRALHSSIKVARGLLPSSPHQNLHQKRKDAHDHLAQPTTPALAPSLSDLTTTISDDTFNPNACQKCGTRQTCASIPTCSRSGGAVTYAQFCKPACVTRAPNDGCPSGQSCSRDGKSAFCDVPRVVAQVRTCAKLAKTNGGGGKSGGGGGGGKKLSDTHPPAVLGGGKGNKIPYGRQAYGQGGSYSKYVPKAISIKGKRR